LITSVVTRRVSPSAGCGLPLHFPEGVPALAQVADRLLDHPELRSRRQALRKVILSNHGSVLD